MDPDPIADLARRINATDKPKAVVYVAGGGTEVFPMLLSRGGGSSTLLSGRIPYDQADFTAILGYESGRLVDARAARGLAMAAFRHALRIRGPMEPDQVFGLGATSKLARGDGEREGRDHEVHAAIQSASRTIVRSVTLPRGADRPWEERINALLLLNLLAAGKGLDAPVVLEADGRGLDEARIIERSATPEDVGHSGAGDVLVGRKSWVALDLDGGRAERVAEGNPPLLLPGSFRPLHEGHRAMAAAAERLTGRRCHYEISLFHPDKPPLDYLAIRSRLEGFGGSNARVYLTDAPAYLDKARLFPGCTFVVGHDTAERLLEPRYYGGVAARNKVLDELEKLGARFLVFGRVDAAGHFRDFRPDDFEHPVAGFLERVAQAVPEHIFRVDLSSTQVRLLTPEDDG